MLQRVIMFEINLLDFLNKESWRTQMIHHINNWRVSQLWQHQLPWSLANHKVWNATHFLVEFNSTLWNTLIKLTNNSTLIIELVERCALYVASQAFSITEHRNIFFWVECGREEHVFNAGKATELTSYPTLALLQDNPKSSRTSQCAKQARGCSKWICERWASWGICSMCVQKNAFSYLLHNSVSRYFLWIRDDQRNTGWKSE